MRPESKASSLVRPMMGMKRPLRLVAGLAAFTWLGSCLDTSGPCTGCPPQPTPLVASNPMTVTAAMSAGMALRSGGAVAEVVYVSLAPGTIPDGGLAFIRNSRTGAVVPAAMADGGFDPVAIEAAANDTLIVTVEVEGGGFTPPMILAVTAARPPVIVRTEPPPRKRDVPLNAVLYAVFSEPIAPSSVGGIRLLHGGVPVNGTAVLSADGLRAEFRPAQPLAANADFELSISTGVTDASGDPLLQPETAEFSTGTTVAVATVFTPQAALFLNSGAVRSFDMHAVLDSAGRVTGDFTLFYPEGGVRNVGRVLCFTIVNGNSVWMAGVVDSSSNPRGGGVKFGWRAADGRPDQLSLAFPLAPDGVLSAEDWCATTPLRDPLFGDIVLQDLTSGDIVVTGDAPPAPPPPPPPPPPPGSGTSQIAFFSPSRVVLVVGADGSGLRQLTGGPNDNNPAWSPDGSKVAFQSDRSQQNDWDIYTVNWDSTGLTRLTSGPETDQDPAWSPDGTQIAFLRNGSIHVMNADGSNVTRVSFASFDSHPSWSPDGSRMVFASSRTGRNAIHVMNADGSNVVQLSDSASDYSPTWSPDGARIAFARKTQDLNEGAYVINPDGSGLTRLTMGVNGHVSWSPDGSRLTYELFGLNLINADGTGIKRMLVTGFNPVWSPVGTVPPAPVPYRSIEQAGGDGQTGVVGDSLALQLRVRVVHDDGTPQPDVHVWWNVFGSGGGVGTTLWPFPSFTDSAGYNSVWVRVGNTPGPIRIRAAVLDGTARRGEVVFTATSVP